MKRFLVFHVYLRNAEEQEFKLVNNPDTNIINVNSPGYKASLLVSQTRLHISPIKAIWGLNLQRSLCGVFKRHVKICQNSTKKYQKFILWIPL